MLIVQKLSFDPIVIQLDIVINGIYTLGWLIAILINPIVVICH